MGVRVLLLFAFAHVGGRPAWLLPLPWPPLAFRPRLGSAGRAAIGVVSLVTPRKACPVYSFSPCLLPFPLSLVRVL